MSDLLVESVEWREREDGAQREHRAALMGEAECERCGGAVPLEAETDGWALRGDGRWHHDSYGPATGECCGLIYAEWWEGCFVFDPEETQEESA